MSNPFEKVARGIAFKMRSKVHKQGYSNTVMAQQARRLSPTGLLAMERLTELTALQQRHQCTFDPALRSKATQILRTLPLLSIDEDPYFTHTQRALRLAAYFGAVDLPVTYALINQHTKNAFMLDAFSMASFFYTLAKLKHPQTKEIVGILLPRLREVAPELIAREAVHILRLLCSIQMADAQLVKVVTETVVATAADVPLRDARQCAFILSETFPEEAQRILGAVEHRLCDDIDMNADANEVKTTILDVCRVVSATCKGPRRLLNSVARRSMELLPQLTPLDVAFVLKAFHLSSYRHLRLLRVLSSSLAASFPTSNVTKEHGLAASIVVQSLAHFYLSGCEEVVVTLVNASVNVLEGLNLALTLLACVRLRCVSPGVDPAVDALCSGAPMRRYVHNAHSMQVTSRILYGLAHAGRCRSDEEVAIVLPLLKSVVRTPGALRDDCRGFLLDAVTALGADGECSNDALQEQVRKVYERLSQDGVRGVQAMFTDSILMSPDFDEEGYLRYAIHASSCKTEQSRLTSCSAAVREEMHNILTENVEDMLQQVTAASCAQRDAAAVRQAAATLMHSASRLRHTIYEPYHLIKGSITKLRNTNVTLNTLRSVIRFINLTTRLKGLLPDDIVRAARTMREVEELLQAANIAAIDVVRSRMDVVERSATVIRSRAQDMLRRADSRDASNVTTALQCFVALGSASRVISGFMTEQKREVMKTLMRELDIQVIANEINDECTATTSDFDYVGSRTCEVLASHLQAALRATATHTGSVIALWRVLVKKADPVTQIPYLSAVDNPTSVLGDYWHFVTDKLRERLQAIQKRPNFFYAMAGDILRYRSLLVTFLDDVVELLELLDQLMGLDASSNGRPNTSGGGGAGACLPSGVEQLRCMWLSHVTREVNERFGAQIMDRHRERLHGVISRLNSIIPSGGNKPLPNLSVDLQRPQVPAIAHVLDVRSYATLAMRDVMEYQRDSQTLSTVLACTLQCLAGFMQRVTETSMRWPLPPLPSVSSDVNTLQMLHICISNACTQLSMDFAVMLASLPEGEEDEDRGEFVGGRDDMWQSSGGGCDGAGGVCCDESAMSTRKLVAERQRKLLEVTINLKKISEKVVRPFFRSVSVLLLDSVSMCVDGACGQEVAGISQLQSQTVHFMSHYYYLFDPQTPTLVDSVRRITDSLIVRLMVAVTLVYPFTKEVREHLTVCLHQVPRVAISFGPSTQGAMGRSTMVLKGQLHQLAMWYNASEEALETPEGVSRAALATLPLVVSRLLLLQRVFRPSAAVGGPSAVMGVTPECFIETIEAAVLDQLCVGNVPEGDLAKRVADNSHAAERLGQVMDAVERCFLMAIEALSGDAAQEATVRWVKQLWVLLDHRQVGK